jgi:hypothetical protein
LWRFLQLNFSNFCDRIHGVRILRGRETHILFRYEHTHSVTQTTTFTPLQNEGRHRASVPQHRGSWPLEDGLQGYDLLPAAPRTRAPRCGAWRRKAGMRQKPGPPGSIDPLAAVWWQRPARLWRQRLRLIPATCLTRCCWTAWNRCVFTHAGAHTHVRA